MAKAPAKKSNILKLSEPVEHGSETITQLEFAPMRGKHLRELKDDPGMGELMDIGAKLASVPPSVINNLCVKDTMRVIEYVGNAIADGQETGKSQFHS